MCVVLGKVCAERQWMKGCLRVSPVLDGNASGEAEDLCRRAGPMAGEEWKKGRLFLLLLMDPPRSRSFTHISGRQDSTMTLPIHT